MAARVLIVDDEEAIRFSLRGILEDEGYEVLEAGSAEEGLATVDSAVPDLVFLDIWLPGMDGMAALKRMHADHKTLPIIMISGHGTIETAVTAIREGAYDFIEKPLSLEKVVILAARALETGHLRRENILLRTALPEENELLGQSRPMQDFRELLAKVAPTDVWVLLTGENGTGKELAARALHALSRRARGPLVAVNCAAIPEELIESELFGHEKGAFTSAESTRIGRFEMAHRGTLFLDEIGDMSLKTQARILRILQEQRFERVGGTRAITVDVRVIAATNKNLEDAIQAGTFREDLYYRLRVMPMHLPPLREREGDIRILLQAYIDRLCKVHGCPPPRVTPTALAMLEAYPWPGNVRELRNFVERTIILLAGKTLTPDQLPPEMRSGPAVDVSSPRVSLPDNNQNDSPPGDAALADPCQDMEDLFAPDLDFKSARALFETRFLERRLRECSGNITHLAEMVGLERSYLHRKLKNRGVGND